MPRSFARSLLLTGLLVALVSTASAAQVPAPDAGSGQTTAYGDVRNPFFEPLGGASGESGFYPGGSYRIEVPSAWNGGLVLWDDTHIPA